MSLAWFGNGAGVGFAAKTSVILSNAAGSQTGDLLLAVFGFEAVGAGSGPYISGTPQAGWSQLLVQDPSASGSGLEVWQADLDFGPATTFNFTGTYTGIARMATYRCANGITAVAYAPATQQWTGNNTGIPSTTTLQDGDEVFAVAAQTLAAPGYGAIVGYFQAFDNTRAGFGTVEITLHDTTQAIAGASGGTAFADTASPAGSKGSTGAFAASCGDSTKHLLPILHAGS